MYAVIRRYETSTGSIDAMVKKVNGEFRSRSGRCSTPRLIPAMELSPRSPSFRMKSSSALSGGDVAGNGLNVLVNNAGYGVFAPLEVVSLEAFRDQLAVNVIAQRAVTGLSCQ
jgi:NAD(P)-dependent dehydrogenase (short-subunit alcohol dehydrogenase family)